MSYNGSGTFQINTSGQPVVTGTSISSTVFNALTADLATGLSTAITKDGQTTTTARIPFALGINSTLVTDATNTTSGSIITAGGVGIAKALYVGTTANVAGAVTLGGVATFSAQPIFSSLTASSAVATDASKGLVSVTNTGTGNNVLATTPTIATPSISSPTISDGTANGVAYLNGSKVLTTGSALVFDGTNLGVGTTTMTQKLNVEGNIGTKNGGHLLSTASNTNAGGLYLDSSGSKAISLRADPDNDASGTYINFVTDGTERARIESGNLLVGTTSTINSAIFTTKSSNSAGSFYRASSSAAFGITEWFSDVGGAQTSRAYMRADGGLANYSANNVNLSDKRTKKNIENSGDYLTKICAIPVRTFQYSYQDDNQFNLGVIAQEVEAVAPELVDSSGFGETPEDGVPLKAIYQTDLQYALMKCIQEQQALITQLTARITALESA